jgi:anti-sigma regulatory factor (Ser/Thr protein kinase)
MARAWIRSKLAGLGVDIDDVVLMTDEVATNAVVHGADSVELRLLQTEKTIRVEICDGGTAWAATPRAPSLTDEDGRGLLIVAALAANWGVDLSHGDTTVWFEAAIDPAHAPSPRAPVRRQQGPSD